MVFKLNLAKLAAHNTINSTCTQSMHIAIILPYRNVDNKMGENLFFFVYILTITASVSNRY